MEGEISVTRSAKVAASPEAVMAWCRSPESRRCWPGAERVWAVGERRFFEVAMRAEGARPAQLHVEEHLRAVEEDDDGSLRLDSDQQWLWPGGEVASAWVTYRVGTGSLELTVRYLYPGGAIERVVNHRRFGPAVGRIVERYLACLVAERPELAVADRSGKG